MYEISMFIMYIKYTKIYFNHYVYIINIFTKNSMLKMLFYLFSGTQQLTNRVLDKLRYNPVKFFIFFFRSFPVIS